MKDLEANFIQAPRTHSIVGVKLQIRIKEIEERCADLPVAHAGLV